MVLAWLFIVLSMVLAWLFMVMSIVLAPFFIVLSCFSLVLLLCWLDVALLLFWLVWLLFSCFFLCCWLVFLSLVCGVALYLSCFHGFLDDVSCVLFLVVLLFWLYFSLFFFIVLSMVLAPFFIVSSILLACVRCVLSEGFRGSVVFAHRLPYANVATATRVVVTALRQVAGTSVVRPSSLPPPPCQTLNTERRGQVVPECSAVPLQYVSRNQGHFNPEAPAPDPSLAHGSPPGGAGPRSAGDSRPSPP